MSRIKICKDISFYLDDSLGFYLGDHFYNGSYFVDDNDNTIVYNNCFLYLKIKERWGNSIDYIYAEYMDIEDDYIRVYYICG